MITAVQTKQPTPRVLQHYALLASLYILLIFILPPNAHTMQVYNLSAIQYHLLLLILVLPSLAIWLTAFVGYLKLQQYAQSIRSTPEGPHFTQLARGSMWLAWGLPLTAIIPLLLNALANNWGTLHPAAIIISNYLNLFFPLVAFSIIASASRGLMNSNVRVKFNPTSARIIILCFLVAGVLYCYLTFRRFDLSSFGSTHNPYFLPVWLMILTITVPYLYAWFIASLAVYELTIFTRQVRGILYQQALRFVIGGLIAVVLSSIAVQYTNSLIPPVGYLVIDYRLALISLFKIIGGAGFILMTIGAIRLKKIEEI